MPKPDTYVPKHRAPGRHKAVKPAPFRAVRTTIVVAGVAAAATGVSVSSGVLSTPEVAVADSVLSAASATMSAEQAERRLQPGASRSDRRGSTDPAKQAALSVADGPAVSREEDLSDADPRDIARALLPEYGFDASQFGCLDSLYVSESNWRIDADNPSSSAYGIPQALTATHDMPAGYMTSAEVQIRWGLDYIASRYGTPCNAWSFKAGHGWY